MGSSILEYVRGRWKLRPDLRIHNVEHKPGNIPPNNESDVFEQQVLDSASLITFVRCIETIVTDKRRYTYIHERKECKYQRNKETCWIPAGLFIQQVCQSFDIRP